MVVPSTLWIMQKYWVFGFGMIYPGMKIFCEMISKNNRRRFMLRKLRRFGFKKDEIIAVYKGYIRPLLEYADVVWNSSLTLKQTKTIEQVQRCACRIVLGCNFLSYNNALGDCEIESLATRRELGRKTIASSLPKGLLTLKRLRIFFHLLGWRVIPAIFAMHTRSPNCVFRLRVLKIALSLTSSSCWINNFDFLTLTSLHAYLSLFTCLAISCVFIYFFCVGGWNLNGM